MRRAAISLAALVLASACTEATEPATAETTATAPTLEEPDGGPPAPDSPEVFPVPAGAACDIRGGWSTDSDPAGLNVRAAPSASAAVVGRLKPPTFDPEMDREMKADFNILEVRDGWVRIRWWRRDDPPVPPSEGWISARYVGFDLQTDKAFVEPDPSSAVVAKTTFVNGREQRFAWSDLAECRGKWVRMTFTGTDGVGKSGWARGVCDGQETSCDGAKGDNLGPDEAG